MPLYDLHPHWRLSAADLNTENTRAASILQSKNNTARLIPEPLPSPTLALPQGRREGRKPRYVLSLSQTPNKNRRPGVSMFRIIGCPDVFGRSCLGLRFGTSGCDKNLRQKRPLIGRPVTTVLCTPDCSEAHPCGAPILSGAVKLSAIFGLLIPYEYASEQGYDATLPFVRTSIISLCLFWSTNIDNSSARNWHNTLAKMKWVSCL